MRIVKPKRLSPGDTIGIVAPASPPPKPETIDAALLAIERLGFRPKLGRFARNRWGFLAGRDRERAADIARMFTDKEVNAIFCIRGGHGTTRLLERLDYTMIRRHPKILVGYSDVTALHCALLTRAGMVSFHGPMLNAELTNPKLPEFTLESLLRTICQPAAPGPICTGAVGSCNILRKGKASGRLIGGNLTLLSALVGTPYEPEYKNAVLFLEDVDEAPYRIDRMLTHLLNAGRLQQVAGIAIGINKGCIDARAAQAKEYRQTVEDVFEERLASLRIPVVMGLPFGHVSSQATLAIGTKVLLDGTRGNLEFMEPAVR